MTAIGDSWRAALPDTEFVAPDAPFAHRSGGRQWFAVDDQVMRPDRIQGARKSFDDLVSEIVKREGFENALDRVAFVGVSQGAIMALDAVGTGRWKVGALVSFAGLLPLPPTSSSTTTPILLMHGAADRTIPSTASVAAKGQLEAAGYDVTLRLFPDVGHTISSEEARKAAEFLRERFD
ncbi:phospholipase/carboxylesterase [Rhizobium sp. PP-CC-2G-626]|nr:phospholipase/carboxylesterase [Rhizobium sp. PP-CC-2G-626]